MLLIVIVIAGGLAIGTVMGLLGSGGAIIAIPILIHALGYPAAHAMGLAPLLMFCTALASFVRSGQTRSFPHVIVYGSTTAVFAFICALYAPGVSPNVRIILFISLIILSSVSILFSRPSLEDSRGYRSPLTLPYFFQHFIFAAVVGSIVGTVGMGGGILLVPILHRFCRLPLTEAMSTSITIILATSSFAFLGSLSFLLSSDVRWLPFLSLTAIGLVCSWWLTKVRHQVPVRKLRIGFAVFLWFLAIMECVYYATQSTGH